MKSPQSILVVDDDRDLSQSLQLYLKLHFQTVEICNQPEELNSLLSQKTFSLILLDMNFRKGMNEGREGLYWLRHIREFIPQQKVIMITAYGEIELAVEALNNGAVDFILKPWKNSHLLKSIKRKLQDKVSEKVEARLALSETDHYQLSSKSKAFQELISQAKQIARSKVNVLISGEHGTGKEYLARFIHQNSQQKGHAFIKISLASLSADLFDAELFGYHKGAFTDAKEERSGLIDLVQDGTLYLEGIENCSLSIQQKLLSFLEDGQYRPLGSNELKQSNFRLICSSDEDLLQAMESGDFRKDLYYRINTVHLFCPALRKRLEDLPRLAQGFLQDFNQVYGKNCRLNNSALKKLLHYPWPGNIRELKNRLERAVILEEGDTIRHQSIVPIIEPVSEFSDSKRLQLDLKEAEAEHIAAVWHLHRGNVSKTAEHLGINRNTLYRKLTKYGIS
tara:strand:+ start:8674 stop:10026 length:1353 start_codon:yes stop_codon:yes gene_type:complete